MTDNKGVYENMPVPITTQHIVLQLQKWYLQMWTIAKFSHPP